MSPVKSPGKRYREALGIGLGIFVILIALYRFPLDDGLRHVGLAFGDARSWGDVYPFSIFQTLSDYNPWYGYDLSLRGLASVFGLLPLPRLMQQFLLTKLLCLVFMGILLILVIRRSKVLEQVTDNHGLALAMLLTPVLLTHSLFRFALIRPFAFGTLFLLYAASAKGAARGALAAGALGFLYPYLAWLYTLPAALANLVRGSRSFAAGVLAATVATLLIQPASFWRMLAALYRSESVRNEIEPVIMEFASLFDHLALFGVFFVAWFVLTPRLPAEERKIGTEHLLLLFFLPLAMRYVRYFADVVLPLFFVVYGRPLVRTLHAPFVEVMSYWREALGRGAARLGWARKKISDTAVGRRRSLKLHLVALYAVILVLMGSLNYVKYAELDSFRQRLEAVPRRSLLLAEFNAQYELLYTRPDLRVIPSSELGFPRADIKDEYIDYFNRGDVCSLARATGAQFFVESGRMYLDPQRTRCLERVNESTKKKIWRIVTR